MGPSASLNRMRTCSETCSLHFGGACSRCACALPNVCSHTCHPGMPSHAFCQVTEHACSHTCHPGVPAHAFCQVTEHVHKLLEGSCTTQDDAGTLGIIVDASQDELLRHSSSQLLRSCLYMYNALENEELNYLELCSSQSDRDHLHATSHLVDMLSCLISTCPYSIYQNSVVQDLTQPLYMLQAVLATMREVRGYYSVECTCKPLKCVYYKTGAP